jgi:hypothetical protein
MNPPFLIHHQSISQRMSIVLQCPRISDAISVLLAQKLLPLGRQRHSMTSHNRVNTRVKPNCNLSQSLVDITRRLGMNLGLRPVRVIRQDPQDYKSCSSQVLGHNLDLPSRRRRCRSSRQPPSSWQRRSGLTALGPSWALLACSRDKHSHQWIKGGSSHPKSSLKINAYCHFRRECQIYSMPNCLEKKSCSIDS